MAEQDAPIWALGLMSGTSMDGVDAAALLTDGVEVQGFGPKRFIEFPDELRADLAAAQGLWQDDRDRLPGIEARLGELYAEAVRFFPTTEIVGMHGQTLSHDPAAFRTHQAGDGAALARDGGKPVVWDFRTADVLSGGEGAPLAPFFHHALARMLGLDRITAFLNIGGVANVTWVDPGVVRPERADALVAFDTGPGNALIDDLVARRGQGSFDRDGALAAGGRVDEAVVAEVLADPYLARPAPKSLDRNHFNWLQARVDAMDTADAAATLAAVTAATIADSVRHMPEPPERWLVCGGGRHNATLMGMIAARTNVEVAPVETEALDGDFLEAQAFAYLAVRVARGMPTSAPTTTGARLPVSGGRISLP